jgi:hypothetical protein
LVKFNGKFSPKTVRSPNFGKQEGSQTLKNIIVNYPSTSLIKIGRYFSFYLCLHL